MAEPSGTTSIRTALITGAAGGIGEAITRRIAGSYSRLVLSYRSTEPTKLVNDLQESGCEVELLQLDLADVKASTSALGALTERLGALHAVVHAAGPHVPMVHLSTVDPEVFSRQVRHDVDAFFSLIHATLPGLRAGRGNVVAVTTAATSRYPVRDGLSSAPKAAVESLVRAFAAEEGRYGVRFNCVGPGMLTDGMADRLIRSGDLNEQALAVAQRNIPLGFFGTAQDIAEAVAFLSSEKARFITGQKLDVDGGYGI